MRAADGAGERRARAMLAGGARAAAAGAALLLGAASAPASSSEPADTRAYDWGLPAWLPPPPVPADNPMSEAKVRLGRHLFHDRRLSADRSVACASCHEQSLGFSDGLATAVGIGGAPSLRNSMSLANVAYSPALTWGNPHMTSLERQALVPLFGEEPLEMGNGGREEALFARLRADPDYRRVFAEAFPDGGGPIELATLTRALAAFQRTLISVDSAYDRYKYGGDAAAMSASALRGEALFFSERLECYHCHQGSNFSDTLQTSRGGFAEIAFYNTGLYNVDGRGVYVGALLAAGTVLFLVGQPRLARAGGTAAPAASRVDPPWVLLLVALALALAGTGALLWLVLRAEHRSFAALLVVAAIAFAAGRLVPDARATRGGRASLGRPPTPEALRPTVRLALAAAALGALATLLGTALQAGHLLDDGWRGAVDPEMLALVATGPSGTAALVRLAGLALILTLCRDGVCPSAIGGALLVVVSFALSGHATGEPRLTASVLLTAHLGAVGFWIGALHPLHRLAGRDETRAEAASAAALFGQQASGAVTMLLVVGVAYAGLLVGAPSALLETPYGRTLLQKVLLVGALLEFAALNKWYLVPSLASDVPQVAARGANGLRRLIGLEAVTFLAVLLTTAVLSGAMDLPAPAPVAEDEAPMS